MQVHRSEITSCFYLEATGDMTYCDSINTMEAIWLDAGSTQQTLAFATFDLNVDTDYSQFFVANASGQNIFTTY